jgi:hypothetical protein
VVDKLISFGDRLDRGYEGFPTPVFVALEGCYTKTHDKWHLSARAGKHEGPRAYLLSCPPTNLLKIDVGVAIDEPFELTSAHLC